jgi:hypothetical protein
LNVIVLALNIQSNYFFLLKNAGFHHIIRKRIFSILLFLCALPNHAQNCTHFKNTQLQINKEVQLLKTLVLGDFSDVPVAEVSMVPTQKDWIADNWVTTRFNPYENTVLEFPFKISFKDTAFTSPILRKKVVTSHFGWRRGAVHKGIDVDLITGDKVLAMLGGKVRYVKWHYGHGQVVVIRHYNGLETVYAHLSKQMVEVNDSVTQGHVIGKGGVSGNARGSHLHLEVRYQGTCLNPEYFFDFGEENKIRAQEIWVNKKWSQAYTQNSRKTAEIHVCHSLEEAVKIADAPTFVHTIKRGDTLSSISHTYQVSVTNLCRTNHISQKTLLRIGQQISIN